MRAQAELMLERYGIVTRETVLAEGVPGGFSTLYGELSNLEMLGTARRGYFVEGLGGAQFALRRRGRAAALAAARGRGATSCSPPPIRPSPTAPALCLAEASRAGRTARAASPAPSSCSATASRCVYVERGGKGLLRLADLDEQELNGALTALVEAAASAALPRLGIERIDGEPAIG